MKTFTVAIVAALVLLDWATKFWVAQWIPVGDHVAVAGDWFFFAHRHNTGVAFSMGADVAAHWRTPLLALVSAAGLILFGRMAVTDPDPVARFAASLVLAGALGNLGDRLVNGWVTDFILVSFFPFVFNVADAVITVGGALLVLRLAVAGDTAERPISAEAASP